MIPLHDDSIDLEAIEIYLGSPEFRDAVSEDDFEARCVALFQRMDAGELFTLQSIAEFLRMRWEAVGVLFAMFAPSYLPPMPGRAMQ
ncbi:MAG: hypothetical protein ACOZAA_09600 [Pseudomonadota bacterium]